MSQPDRTGSRRSNLLFVVTRGHLDAAGRKRIYDLLPLFRCAGHRVRIVSFEWEWIWRARSELSAGGTTSARLLRLTNAARVTPLLLRVRDHIAGRRFRRLVSWADAVIVNQTPLNDGWRSRLRDCGKLVVYDVDDAIWLRRGAESAMFGLATVVAAGSEYLATQIRAFHPHVVTIPTAVRVDRYDRARARVVARPREGGCVIGWVGSPTTAKYLDILVEPLATLGASLPVTLDIVGTRGAILPPFRNVRLRVHAGVPYDPVDFVPQFDIGVMPLTDGDWERGKCGAKALEYMAAGVPAVCSAVGENVRVVEHGVSGLLVNSSEDWVNALRSLAGDPCRRRVIGEAGRARVREVYSADRAVSLWSDILKGQNGAGGAVH